MAKLITSVYKAQCAY